MYDLLIANTLIVDGSGSPAFRGSVGVTRGLIATVMAKAPGDDASTSLSRGPRGSIELDGADLVLAPGFIDAHTHSDLGSLVDPSMQSTIRQGVTTVVVGNCGSSAWPAAGLPECAQLAGADPDDIEPFASYSDYLERLGSTSPAVNIAALVGHGSVRREVMGLERHPPNPEQMESMRRLVADAMDGAAIGLSTGLIYAPGSYAATEELIELAVGVARAGGIYASHIRGEGAHLFTAVDEARAIGRTAGLPAHVSHLKCESTRAWGRTEELLARFHGEDNLTADQYPYTAWASSLASFLPDWAPVLSLSELLADVGTRRRLVAAIEHGEDDFQSSVDGVGWDRVVIESSGAGHHDGRDIEAIASDLGVDPIASFFALLVEDPDTSCVGHAMDAHDVREIIRDPSIMVASDGVSMSPEGPLGTLSVHPRNYGTFPRVIGDARRHVLTLESAIRKMTSLPAERFGLAGRGRIVEGAEADLVLFDPRTIDDDATYADPHRYPIGLEAVIVGGGVAWSALGSPTIERRGRILRRT